MKISRIITVLLLTMVPLLCSCSQEQNTKTEPADKASERIEFVLENTAVQTKGAAVTADQNAVKDVTLVAYTDKGVLSDCRYFRGDEEMFLMLNKAADHTVYAIANIGDISSRIGVSVSSLNNLSEKVSWESINAKGFPMSGSAKYAKGSSSVRIPMERLLAKVTLTIDTDWPSGTSFKLKKVTVGNTNSVLSLFSPSAATKAGDLMTGDYSVTMGTPMTFYLPENMHGDLLASNNDPYRKNKEQLVAKGHSGKADLCSYMDVVLTQNDTYGVSGERKYRFYIGRDNTRNFDVERNTDYRITLRLTSDGFNIQDNWKVDNGGVSDSRTLAFGRKEFLAVAGATSYIDVRYSRGGVMDSSYGYFNTATGWEFIEKNTALDISTRASSQGIAVTPLSGKVRFGDRIPIRIHTFDDAHSDEAYINITLPDIETTWSSGFAPAYIAQKGTLSAKVPDGLDSISFEIAEGSEGILEAASGTDGHSVQVSCIGSGNGKIRIIGHTGSTSVLICEKDIPVAAPVLTASSSSVSVNATGGLTALAIRYKDKNGMSMSVSETPSSTSFDSGLYERLLKPTARLSGNDAGMFLNNSAVAVFADKVEVNGRNILDYCGTANAGTFTFAPCNPETAMEIAPVSVKCTIEDPFPGASASRLFGYINNKYDGAVGSVHTSALDVNEKKSAVFETVVTSLSNNVYVRSAAEDMDIDISSKKIKLARKTGMAGYSAGKYDVYGRIYNTRAGKYSPEKVIGCFESYIMTGFVANTMESLDDYLISASFANRFNISYFDSMISSISVKNIFGFHQGSTTYKSTTYYVFDHAEDYSGVYIDPDSYDFYSWGSWCDVVAYDDNHLVSCNKTIYTHHIGETDRYYWGFSGDDFFSAYEPQVRVDASALGTISGISYTVSGQYRLLYSTSDTKRGKAGVPYHVVGLPTSKNEMVSVPWNRQTTL